jgi:AraC-like DNA-binding protein
MNTSFLSFRERPAGQYIRAIWQLEGMPPYRQETILPKGVLELIFSFSQEVWFGQGRDKNRSPRCFINGMTTVPLYIEVPAHQFFFGIEFHPLGFKKLLAVPPGEFLNRVTDLTLLDPAYDRLWQRLGEAAGFAARVALIEQWAARKLQRPDERDQAFSTFLDNSLPARSVAGLAGQLCYSPRQLHRKAQDLFGLPTDGLIRYKRYLQSLALVHQGKGLLTEIGHSCGFYDQAHFIREFRDFTGLTPGAYRRQKSFMPGHLFR